MRVVWTLLIIFVLGVCASAFAFRYFVSEINASGPLATEKLVVIASGTGLKAMGEQLEHEGIIQEALMFIGAAKLMKVGGQLQAGEYQIPVHASVIDVLDMMVEGDVFARKITIPEGLSSVEIVKIINATNNMRDQIERIPDEGSILPETYMYSLNESRYEKLAQMQRSMRAILDFEWEKRASDLPFETKKEALVLASIIEKETGIQGERDRIAGVFVNRLRKGMPLQSDPTVIYAITKGKSKIERVLYQHLDVDSPYNTYRVRGLPPTPICNPGTAAIRAAMNPEKHDYLYFVADGTGGHVFAKTIQEHNANVIRWRAIAKKNRQEAAKSR